MNNSTGILLIRQGEERKWKQNREEKRAKIWHNNNMISDDINNTQYIYKIYLHFDVAFLYAQLALY